MEESPSLGNREKTSTGPRINSEELHPTGYDALGLKCSYPIPFFYVDSSKAMTGQRHLTNG